MPGYRTHTAVAGIAGLLLLCVSCWQNGFQSIQITNVPLYMLAAVLGSLFPDIDIKSRGQRLWYLTLAPMFLLAALSHHTVGLISVATLAIIPPLLPHRGLTHELWFIFLAPLVIPLATGVYLPSHVSLAYRMYLYFVMGALTHPILDFGKHR